MALYAFDGTWNENERDNDKDTNVRKFYDAYLKRQSPGTDVFKAGPGTRFGFFGQVVGGLTGAGAKARVEEAYQLLKKNFQQGDKDIDIVGFSRGAAIALDFANRIAEEGVAGEKAPPIRFLGLWDTVASFGLPGNEINIGFTLGVPGNVRKCCHALALDERRRTFPPERLARHARDEAAQGRILEVWFRGVHSDVGGGYEEQDLSSITLGWMIAQAQRCGLAFDEAHVKRHERLRNASGPIHGPKGWQGRLIAFIKDPLPDKRRKVRQSDVVHESVVKPPKGIARIDDAGNIRV